VEDVVRGKGLEDLKADVDVLKKESKDTKKELVENRVELQQEWIKALTKKEEDIRKSFAQVVKEDKDIKNSFVQIVKEEEEQWILNRNKTDKDENKQGNIRKDIRMGVVEELEREKRRSNLVLMGVPEEGADGEGRDIVSDVVKGLVPEVAVEFVIVGRIGKKGTVARPVRIRVEDQGHRRKLLSRAKDLKGKEGLQRIYIVPDLTRMQQQEDKVLRDEVKRLRTSGENGARIEKGVVVIRNTINEVVRTDRAGEASGSRI
jgi:hypothetical protein